ncbi:O-fucosyltransferase 23 isoform X1 [Elaeis guineensis]|uniref:O-fucosyltransferase family protein n=1 Tax=Elaeis guineensis var. tenera TaxID=51953 RepID=A0A6I9SED7_ELAGV|nr:O-fucosyltransferase 23 isoform X1 [Elaeis guineensis]XP_029116223.1 O-fucosyltransferase 23 isoform X1 [Elaeis guineensis]XP_029116224.1 O-fucosyltransferase 23 isoform X1 [Elaeis guineensis]XP_029116225.1 O-fucosyltransferase 23 isoform X1 [Elaeis guineensis]XP_029116226.1 O-fucosyltransferase 23 isoform X1 [Elaeis guineensis]
MIAMDSANCKLLKLISCHLKPMICRFFVLAIIILVFRTVLLSPFPGFHWFRQRGSYWVPASTASNWQLGVRRDKFLEVPQIIWGLNNQKIAFARAILTARFLNRTLLIPSLSASLFYKEIDLLEPISFDKLFHFEKFNYLCNRFVRLGRYSDLSNQTEPFELQKGSGRKWTKERDLSQLKQCREYSIDKFEVIRIAGKHPFLWHDHWPVKNYAKIFECLELVDEIANEAMNVISRIRGIGAKARSKVDVAEEFNSDGSVDQPVPYIAVHMRIEKDWMIHCKKLEQKSNINQICSSKEEIMERVAHITGLQQPVVVYLAVADSLLEDNSILSGWKDGLVPYEKKRLGVWDIYKKYPYLIQSAIDYEVCSRADVFVGNSFSTFSSIIVLSRTQKLIGLGITSACGVGVRFASYAYNILGESRGPKMWMTDMSAPSLQSISYGTSNVSCYSNWKAR